MGLKEIRKGTKDFGDCEAEPVIRRRFVAGLRNFAEIALKRAAQTAREFARNAGTSVVILKDGEITEEQYDNHAHSGR